MNSRSVESKASTTQGIAALLLWSTTIALSRSLSESVGSLTAAAAVYLVGGVLCLPFFFKSGFLKNRVFQLPGKYLAGCGILFLLYTALLYLAVGQAQDREQALEIGLINYLWPAMTILLSLWLLGKRTTWLLWPGTALALMGIVLVMTQGAVVSWKSFWAHFHSNPLPYLFALAAALSWALYSNLTRRWAGSEEGGAVALFIPATGMVLLALRLTTEEQSLWTSRAVVETLFLGATTALAYGLWDSAMRRGNLVLVVVSSYFTPLLSTIISCLYLGVMPGTTLWMGCLMIILGSLLSWRSVSYES